jgi:predicted DNA-binding transcriptional regulator AlpA
MSTEEAPEEPNNDATEQPPPIRLIFRKELQRRVGLSYPTIWRMMREDRFPPARVIGGRSAWFEHEVDQYLAKLPLRRYKK